MNLARIKINPQLGENSEIENFSVPSDKDSAMKIIIATSPTRFDRAVRSLALLDFILLK